jgi:hypothetical protein
MIPRVGSVRYQGGTVAGHGDEFAFKRGGGGGPASEKAAEEGRSMQEVARAAIAEYVSDRPGRLRAAIERVRIEDAELLDRLSR